MSKTPGGQAASAKFMKKEAQSMTLHKFSLPAHLVFTYPMYIGQPYFIINTLAEHGEGASNAPGHTEGKAPGDVPAASDSGISNVGIEKGTNQPGEKGNLGPTMGSIPDNLKDTRGVE